MNATRQATFQVSDVVRADRPLPEIPCGLAIEWMLTPESMDNDPPTMRTNHTKTDLASGTPRTLEAWSLSHPRLVAGMPMHPVIAAAHAAFRDHRPLRLFPDAIWLMICQAVASHVNAHADEQRPRLVRHQGEIELQVRRDEFVKGSSDNDWPGVFREFVTALEAHVGPTFDHFLPAFSTTGPTERAVAAIVLMNSVRSYFRYSVATLCGIPEITLEGTAEDWEMLASRAEAFAGIGLDGWLEVLRPVLGQFARASRGEVDQAFWRSLYKYEDMSGGRFVTGWLLAFFPYLKDNRTGEASQPVPMYFGRDDRDMLERALYPDEDDGESDTFWAPVISSFPSGLSSVPFRWDLLGVTIPMEFVGGFVGVSQDQKTFALRPEIGWAVRNAHRPGKPPRRAGFGA